MIIKSTKGVFLVLENEGTIVNIPTLSKKEALDSYYQLGTRNTSVLMYISKTIPQANVEHLYDAKLVRVRAEDGSLRHVYLTQKTLNNGVWLKRNGREVILEDGSSIWVDKAVLPGFTYKRGNSESSRSSG